MIMLEPIQRVLFDSLNLPRWLPDEYFHSLVSRYHILTGHGSRRRTAARLFGNASCGSKHDFPVQLQSFVDRTRAELGSVEDIVHRRTIAPLFFAFISSSVRADVILAMSRRGAGVVPGKLGLLRSSLSYGHPLKVCLRCKPKDRAQYGVAYLHREHQLPGSWICIEHECSLTVIQDIEATPKEWILPQGAETIDYAADRSWTQEETSRALHLAKFVHQIVALPYGFSFDLDALRRTLKGRLLEQGLCTPRGVVRLSHLESELTQFWKFLADLPGSLPLSFLQGRALGRLLDRSERSSHPLTWLAVAAFAFEDSAAFFRSYDSELLVTSRRDPDQKLDPPTDDRGKVQTFRSMMAEGKTLSESACGAGIALSVARRWCVIHGIDPARILANVPLDKRARIGALYEAGASQEDIARELGIDVTLVRYTLDSIPNAAQIRQSTQLAETRDRCRAEVLGALCKVGTSSRVSIRAQCPASYSWLLKFDREWMEKILPSDRSNRAKRSKSGKRSGQLELLPST